MSNRLTDEAASGFFRDGYIVFRGLVPPALLGDLRRETDKAREIARQVRGSEAQRLQPMSKFADRIDLRPFEDLCQLPELCSAIEQLLGPNLTMGGVDTMGVLVEPANGPYSTHWHRDITAATSRLPADEFEDLMRDWRCVNQINCPLYADDSLWFVPGSHLRSHDLPGETAVGKAPVERFVPDAATGKVEATYTPQELIERELKGAAYARSMPGAINLPMQAGDYALYRPIAWHLGNYLPYRKRATLHDALMSPVYERWWKEWRTGASPRWTRPALVAGSGTK